MAKHTLTDVKAFLAGYNVSGVVNSLEASLTNDVKETTTFGSDHRTRISGLDDSTFRLSGFWESDEDYQFFNSIGAVNDEVLTIAPNGSSVGDAAFLSQIKKASYSPGASIGEVFAFSLEMTGNKPLIKGNVLQDGAVTSSGQSTAVEIPAVPSGSTLFCHLHVVANDGSGNQTLDVTLVSDDDGTFDSASTTRLTFDQITTSNGGHVESIAGPITDTHWRLEWAVSDDSGESPSFTIFAAFGVTSKV